MIPVVMALRLGPEDVEVGVLLESSLFEGVLALFFAGWRCVLRGRSRKGLKGYTGNRRSRLGLALYWVAVKELTVRYHSKETLHVLVCLHILTILKRPYLLNPKAA